MSAQHRSHIAALGRRMDAVGRELKQLKGSVRKKPVAAPSEDQNEGVHRRFNAERLAATRSKLGLFAADFGTLMGLGVKAFTSGGGKGAAPPSNWLQLFPSVESENETQCSASRCAARLFRSHSRASFA
jgi:hypothetical protein